MKPRNYYYLHIRFLKYMYDEENAHDFLRVPIGACVLVHSFSMYSFVLDFSITQQQLINETLSFFYSYSFISLSLSPSLGHHGYFSTYMSSIASLISSIVIVLSSPAKSLSSVRKSMQWHSFRSRIGMHGQFQKPAFTSASLSS